MQAISKLSCVAVSLAAITLQGCTGGSGSSVINVTHIEPRTIQVETRLDGTTSTTEVADPALKGPKKIGIQIGIQSPTTVSTILFTYWRAGNATGTDTEIIEVNESFDEDDVNTGYAFFHIPDGMESLEPCEGAYYIWTVNYTGSSGEPATYVSQRRLVFITKQRVATGQIQQALCEPAPGPGEG